MTRIGRSLGQLLRDAANLSRIVAREFTVDQCTARAAGLAFASLMAMVPLSAVLFSLFSALGTFTELSESLRSFLFRQLLPMRQQEVIEYLGRFVENTERLGVVGLLLFLGTSILLMAAIQRTFDAVWGAKSRRISLGHLVTYASVLVVGSFLINIGLNLTGAIRTVLGTAVADETIGSSLFFSLFPPAFVFVAIALMIKLIPSPKVAMRSAMLGAVVGSILWAVAQVGFVYWTSRVMRLSIVYGSLAAIPIFLIWLYLGWMIVLAALEVTFVHQYQIHRRGPNPETPAVGPGVDLLQGLETYFVIAERFVVGREAPTVDEIGRTLGVPVRDLRQFIDSLLINGIITTSGRRANRYLPAKSLENTSVFEVQRALNGTQHLGIGVADLRRTAVRLFLELTGSAESAIEGATVADYLRRALQAKRKENESTSVNPGSASPAEADDSNSGGSVPNKGVTLLKADASDVKSSVSGGEATGDDVVVANGEPENQADSPEKADPADELSASGRTRVNTRRGRHRRSRHRQARP